jgi:hypothetical protein
MKKRAEAAGMITMLSVSLSMTSISMVSVVASAQLKIYQDTLKTEAYDE